MLLNFIEDDQSKKFDYTKMVIDALKPYLNLELYQHEQEVIQREKTRSEELPAIRGYNSLYDKMVEVGRATGQFWLPDSIRESLTELRKSANKRQINLDRPGYRPPPVYHEVPPEEELG